LVIGPKVLIPSKDLRIFDPDLKHVVLIDDNPGRVFQPKNLRSEPVFNGDIYLNPPQSADQKSDLVRYYDHLLNNVADDIEDSAKAARKMHIPFAQAFLPYSYWGE